VQQQFQLHLTSMNKYQCSQSFQKVENIKTRLKNMDISFSHLTTLISQPKARDNSTIHTELLPLIKQIWSKKALFLLLHHQDLAELEATEVKTMKHTQVEISQLILKEIW
jgi:hypothetical protein